MKLNNRLARWLLIVAIAFCANLISGSVQQALACPMCKAATEEDDAKPRAYMYSILFMLAVPGTMVGGIAARLITLSRRESASLAKHGLTDDVSSIPVDDDFGSEI
ncbi:hypothetical protein GC176_23355 [bacterium]|nr:hypothetical protein [bacterium]